MGNCSNDMVDTVDLMISLCFRTEFYLKLIHY